MADFVNLDNEQDNLLEFLNLTKDVIGDAPSAHAAIISLTDNTGGTGDDTLAAISGSGADAGINNNFADLGDKIEEILGALRTIGLLTP